MKYADTSMLLDRNPDHRVTFSTVATVTSRNVHIAVCSCGWRSSPRSELDWAHNDWETHLRWNDPEYAMKKRIKDLMT